MHTWRNIFISIFVVLWVAVFHYESLRHFYLEPLAGRTLPKVKFLFAPAGWIMFFRVDKAYGNIDVYGFKGDMPHKIDPHEIFKVRTVGYDNIRRGVIGSAASQRNRRAFCKHLNDNFAYFDNFRIVYTYYPDFIEKPYETYQQILYACSGDE